MVYDSCNDDVNVYVVVECDFPLVLKKSVPVDFSLYISVRPLNKKKILSIFLPIFFV